MPKPISDTLPFYTSRFLLRLLAYQTALVKRARRTPRKYQVIGYKFKAHNQTVGRSPKTAQQYNESLNPATDGCRAEGCPPTWTTRGEDEVREFILYNQDRRGLWREIVLHIRESKERASGRFRLDVPPEQHRGAPLQELEPPVVIEKVIEPLTHEQIAKIFDSMNPNTVLGARNKAIYSLMLTPASGYSKSPT